MYFKGAFLLAAIAASHVQMYDTKMAVGEPNLLQVLVPSKESPLVGNTTNQFSYASSLYKGGIILNENEIISTTKGPTLLLSNQVFNLTDDALTVFEVAISAESELYLDPVYRKETELHGNFLFGTPIFGAVSAADDWQFFFFTTNSMIYAVLGYFPPKTEKVISPIRKPLHFMYAVPVAERARCDVNVLAITFNSARKMVDWWVDGCLKMRIQRPADPAAVSGKFMFAQRPGMPLPIASFPKRLRMAIGNVDLINLYGAEFVGKPNGACECAMIHCPNPNVFNTVSVTCHYGIVPQPRNYSTRMKTKLFYTLVANINRGEVVGGGRRDKPVKMDYPWFFERTSDFRTQNLPEHTDGCSGCSSDSYHQNWIPI